MTPSRYSLGSQTKKLVSILMDEPFRLFFPLGVLGGLLGILFWPIKMFHWAYEETSTKLHVWMQIYGFMNPFIIGFLTTAIPRFTQTMRMQLWELLVLAILTVAGMVSVMMTYFIGGHYCFVVSSLFLVFVLGRRFRTKQKSPPDTFVFIPFAFGSAIIGGALQILVASKIRWHIIEIQSMATGLIFQGFVLFLLMGIGGFLIRSILGWSPELPVQPGQSSHVENANYRKIFWFVGLASLIFISFICEAFIVPVFFMGLRALLVSLFLLKQIKIYRLPRSGKLTSRWLWVAQWMLFVGLWGVVCWPSYQLAFIHLCFIGGFALSVVCVATRVIFSHCGCSHLLNQSYKPFSWAASLIFFGMITRFSATFMPESYSQHLSYAGFAWSAGLLIWTGAILTKSLRDTWTKSLA